MLLNENVSFNDDQVTNRVVEVLSISTGLTPHINSLEASSAEKTSGVRQPIVIADDLRIILKNDTESIFDDLSANVTTAKTSPNVIIDDTNPTMNKTRPHSSSVTVYVDGVGAIDEISPPFDCDVVDVVLFVPFINF